MNVRKNYILLMASVAGIILVSVFSTRIIPLYDGVGFPDEPYRYVNPSNDAQKKSLPPSPAEAIAVISNSTNPSDFSLASLEQGPQVNIYVYKLSLKNTEANAKVDIKAEPRAPDNAKTPKGKIAGNFYSLSAISDRGVVSFKAGSETGYIYLRLPQGFPVNAEIVYRTSTKDKWQALTTTQSGADVYEAKLAGFGDYALMSDKAKPTDSNHSPVFVAYIMAAIIAVLVVALIVLRKQHTKTKKHKNTE